MKPTWRHDLFKPHKYAKRKCYYYEFKKYKIYKAYRQEIKDRLSKESPLNRFEKFLISKGFDRLDSYTKKPFLAYSTMGCVDSIFIRDEFIIRYGLYEYGIPPHLISIEDYINTINYKSDDNYLMDGQIAQRIEEEYDHELILNVLINKDKLFIYDYNNDSIKLIKK